MRVYERYQREVVEALGLCPWAERARRDGRVRHGVVLEAAPGTDDTAAAVRRMGEDATVDIALLIFPNVELDRPAFERFVGAVRAADAAVGPVVMALAAFHPDAPADITDPARLVPFLRRTPDPTIQLVRRSVLDRVRGSRAHGTGFVDPAQIDLADLLEHPTDAALHERVAQANLDRIRALGVARVRATLDDIRRDRNESYARIAR